MRSGDYTIPKGQRFVRAAGSHELFDFFERLGSTKRVKWSVQRSIKRDCYFGSLSGGDSLIIIALIRNIGEGDDPGVKEIPTVKIPVFLSYPKPHLQVQQQFIERVSAYLQDHGFEPRTLGVTDYDMSAPLKAIRRLMLESNGLVTIAFKRTLVKIAIVRAGAELPDTTEEERCDFWLTSPYCQIEPAMAYQLGLPILILREKGVINDGLLDKGVVGSYMPEFDLDKPIDDYFGGSSWKDVIGRWEGFARAVVEIKGNPPRLFTTVI